MRASSGSPSAITEPQPAGRSSISRPSAKVTRDTWMLGTRRRRAITSSSLTRSQSLENRRLRNRWVPTSIRRVPVVMRRIYRSAGG